MASEVGAGTFWQAIVDHVTGPPCRPMLNEIQAGWPTRTPTVELANLTCPTLAEVIQQAHRGIDRVRRTPHLAYAFLRHAGLSVA
jgi:hypothetical protein